MLKRWYWRASHSRIEVIRELARKIKRHRDNIFNTIQNGLSNARLEAINNKSSSSSAEPTVSEILRACSPSFS